MIEAHSTVRTRTTNPRYLSRGSQCQCGRNRIVLELHGWSLLKKATQANLLRQGSHSNLRHVVSMLTRGSQGYTPLRVSYDYANHDDARGDGALVSIDHVDGACQDDSSKYNQA